MTITELIILAITLSFDTFAVSISGGISLPKLDIKRRGLIISFFSVFQASFLFIGWLIAGNFSKYIITWDHWIALFILCYLGGKMIKESFSKENDSDQGKSLLNIKKLTILSIATSIDAIAVGVSLAFIHLQSVKMLILVLLTLIITAIAALIGLISGQKLGNKVGKRAELIGGIVLIIIGVKVWSEHLFFAA